MFDMGPISQTVFKLKYRIDAEVSSVTGYAIAEAQDYSRFTGAPIGMTRYGAGQATAYIGLTNDGYLVAEVPAGRAGSEKDVSGGIAITGIGFDGKSRLGTITVQVNAAYHGVVSYNASFFGLEYIPQAGAQSQATTVSFVYEAVE